MSETLRYSVIGPGRAGRGLIEALRVAPGAGASWHLAATYGRSDDVGNAAADVDLLIIAVPDDDIADVAASVTPTRAVVAHMAGAKTLAVLRPHDRVASIHPLASLPDPITAARRLTSGIAFAVAGEPIVADLVDALGGEPFEVPDHQRTRYHATAAVAANHLTVLCGQVERLAASVGIPVDRYWDLMASTLETIKAGSAKSALTGPAARGDNETIQAHLSDLPAEERPLYGLLATEAKRLAAMDDPASPSTVAARPQPSGAERTDRH